MTELKGRDAEPSVYMIAQLCVFVNHYHGTIEYPSPSARMLPETYLGGT